MPRETGNVEDFEKAAARLKTTGDKTSGPDWLRDCQKNKNGDAIANLANALLALRCDPAWQSVLSYDEMRRCVMLLRPTPAAGAKVPNEAFAASRALQDDDVTAVQEWLHLSELRRLAKDTAHQAVDLVARENPAHPLRQYLESLK